MMPLKTAKKVASKRKQNGKKVVKGQVTKAKQKYEMEVTPKEQISELDKEIFSIKISESESKLQRKKHLCSFIEEEMSIYKTLYNEKQLLKSESMKLLNKAFEDFGTEIFLLHQELGAMQHTYSKIVEKQTFCYSYRERVKLLRALEAKLEENVFESEKCFEELPELSETFQQLQERVSAEKEMFISKREKILREFETCLIRIRDKLNAKTCEAIEDSSLKLNLLPVPHKTLFLTGWLSDAWLDSAVRFYEDQLRRNAEMAKKYCNLQLVSVHNKESLKTFFQDNEILLLFQFKSDSEIESNNEAQLLEKGKKLVPSVKLEYPEFKKLLLYLEMKCLHQQNKIKSMKSEMRELETAIESLEVSKEINFEKSYVIQIVHKAGSILKEEL